MKIKPPLDVRILALCTTYLLLPVMACPLQCVCIWKNGKKHVECVDKDLKKIPGPLDPETQILDFSGNDIQVLQKETFQTLGLIDLQKIYLARCRLHKLDNYSFKGLANLVELDLSYNYLTIVPTSNFIFFPSLMKLFLNNNPITTIKAHCFQHLMFLNTLELSECKIEKIEIDAFAGLHHLEWLRLNGNMIANIEGNNLFPDTLKGISLYKNRWRCDCHLRDLHDWLLKFKITHEVEPVCNTPERLKAQKIENVPVPELACRPTLKPTTVIIETNENSNVSLECSVTAVPAADITWWFQGHMLHNQSLDELDFKTSYTVVGSTEKKSELFIYNTKSHDNGTYYCIAENIAGKVNANYTIKVFVKPEPVVVVASFPRKNLVMIVTIIFLVIILVIAIVAVVLLKFKTDNKSRKKRDSGKEVALRNENSVLNSASGRSLNAIHRNTTNGSLINNKQTHHVVHYKNQDTSDEANQSDTINNFSDRNPDIISAAETNSINVLHDNAIVSDYNRHFKTDNMNSQRNFPLPTVRQVTWQDQQSVANRNVVQQDVPHSMYQCTADIHLNPGCFLDSEGYPYDYGLPKMPCRRGSLHSNYATATPGYQTLPHNRSKGQKLACNFAKNTELNSPPCLKYVSGNSRHTVDRYPMVPNRSMPFATNGNVYNTKQGVKSVSEGYMSEPPNICHAVSSTEPCSSSGNLKGTCAVMIPMDIPENGPSKCYHVETRCVDTQTSEIRNQNEKIDKSKQNTAPKYELEACTESPDEGYGDDI